VPSAEIAYSSQSAGCEPDTSPGHSLAVFRQSRSRTPRHRSATIVGVPLTTSLKGEAFRVRLKKGTGGLRNTSEVACEQVVQVPKRNFVPDEHGVVRPLGGRVEEKLLDDVVVAVVAVISA